MSIFPTNILNTGNIPDFNPANTLAASNHADRHNDLRDEVIAAQAKIGSDGSTDNTTHSFKLSGVTGADKAASVAGGETLLNKKLSDSTTSVVASADTTKGFRFSVGGTSGIIGLIATAFTTAKTITFPDITDTVVTRTNTETLTNKTLTLPVIASISNSGTITVPAGTDTLVGRATTDTLTNKTITKPVLHATNPTAQTYSPAASGTATLDCALGNQHDITMPAGNITIALSNVTNSQIFTVSITQDGTGSRTVTWFTTIRWAGGVAPTLTTTGSKRDVFIFKRTGASTYDGFIVGQNV